MITPVSFELSKLLKEKGFNQKCLHHYSKYTSNKEELKVGNTTWLQFVDWNDVKSALTNYTLYSAPTIAEVVMWCFNKYKYSIEYSMNIPESGEYDGCYVFNGLIKGSEDYKLKIFYTSKDYPTAEKALEDTINHFLINFF